MSKLSLCILCCPQNMLEMRGFPFCIVHDNCIFFSFTPRNIVILDLPTLIGICTWYKISWTLCLYYFTPQRSSLNVFLRENHKTGFRSLCFQPCEPSALKSPVCMWSHLSRLKQLDDSVSGQYCLYCSANIIHMGNHRNAHRWAAICWEAKPPKYSSVIVQILSSVLKTMLILLTDITSSFLHCWDRSLMPLTNSLLALT